MKDWTVRSTATQGAPKQVLDPLGEGIMGYHGPPHNPELSKPLIATPNKIISTGNPKQPGTNACSNMACLRSGSEGGWDWGVPELNSG